MRAAFEEAYRLRFAFLIESRALIVEAVSVEAVGRGERTIDTPELRAPRSGPLSIAQRVRMFSGGRFYDAPLYLRADTRPGDVMLGPAIIVEDNQATVVEPGWRGDVTARDQLVLMRVEEPERAHALGSEVDPVRVEVFNNLFFRTAARDICSPWSRTPIRRAPSTQSKHRLAA